MATESAAMLPRNNDQRWMPYTRSDETVTE